MKTFANIWNYFNGTLPNITAKAASGLGAKDGTEWKTTYVDEMVLGWVQGLFDKSGQTPNGTKEAYNQSQILDMMREVFSTPESQVVNSSGAIVLGKTDHKIELDVSLGNISVSLPAPDFTGQKLYIFTTGSGIADITGTGLYVNKIFQTSNTGVLIITAISSTEWRAENGVTADYASGAQYVIKYSTGLMENIGATVLNTAIAYIVPFNGGRYIEAVISLLSTNIASVHNISASDNNSITFVKNDASQSNWRTKGKY